MTLASTMWGLIIVGTEHANHLIYALDKSYTVSKIGQAVYIVALHSTGITLPNMSPFPCRGTSLMRSTNTSMQCQKDLNMPLAAGHNRHMANASNMHHS
jgi:hypothetical protein